MSSKHLTGWAGLFLIALTGWAQPIATRLDKQVHTLLQDPTMKHASFSLSVLDGATGKAVYQYNEQVGLAPASTLKVLTSITALAELGAKSSFETVIGYTGEIKEGVLQGNLVIKGGGDPSLGSWRYQNTKEDQVLNRWVALVKKAGITTITGGIQIDQDDWDQERVPDGWIWQDLGNYYGAGAGSLNWRENQFDVYLAAGPSIGARVKITKITPALTGAELRSALTTGPRGSGDNAYIYLPPNANKGVIRGTIPLGEQAFQISGALPDPSGQLKEAFASALSLAGIELVQTPLFESGGKMRTLGTESSPSLDSLVYWFMRKSINLYGEAMVKQLAVNAGKKPSTSDGIDHMISFWKQKNIDPGALQLMDGSGLSPQNRITTDALTTALYWAQKQSWYNVFYQALPAYNGMKIKSGSINGARAYAGYHKAADGKNYILAIIVNNYTGSGGAAVRKLYSVLDVLK